MPSHGPPAINPRATSFDLGTEERRSSSGLIAATGTAATGWTRSIQREREQRSELLKPTERVLAFIVREASPRWDLASITQGMIGAKETLEVICEQEAGAAIFEHGIEGDRIEARWGQLMTVRVAERLLKLALA